MAERYVRERMVEGKPLMGTSPNGHGTESPPTSKRALSASSEKITTGASTDPQQTSQNEIAVFEAVMREVRREAAAIMAVQRALVRTDGRRYLLIADSWEASDDGVAAFWRLHTKFSGLFGGDFDGNYLVCDHQCGEGWAVAFLR